MKLAFSTLGCPNWELEQIIQAARRLGYDGVELRAIGGSLNLLSRDEFLPKEIASTRQLFAASGIEICAVDTSCTFHSADQAERDAQVELAIAHGVLAEQLGAPLIRVFPDQIQHGSSRVETRDHIAESLHRIAERMPSSVQVALETHGDFARTEAASEIVRLADHPRVKLTWDVANSLAAGDSINVGARNVAPHLAHIHLRDARPVPESEHWLPVLAGRGNVSFAKTLAVIDEMNYDGYVSFEWEKYWHPEIEEPDVALSDFIDAIRKTQSDTTKSSGVGK
ncbi:MAG TPA: sugar phosphate isomerase/epimerase family protein [Pyrinomonadaceae bacterium]|nr:sugar phosphate isomerase/epimerase family protein [Pyrinomonadaceae bacterium]